MSFFSKVVGAVTGGIFNAIFKPISKLLEWLVDTPNAPARQGLKVQREGSDNSLPVIYGTRKVGAVLVHKIVTDQSGGADNEFLHYIAAFCHGEVDAIEEIFFNGISENDPQWAGWLQIQRALGGDEQDALSLAVSQIPNWGAVARGRGVCYAYIRLRQDEEQRVWRGEPQITARIRGKRVYDWRTDTFGYSENPAVCTVDYLLSSVYGRGLSESEINYAQFTAAADFCDEGTTSTVTETECFIDGDPTVGQVCTTTTRQVNNPRYKLAALIDTNNTVLENYHELLGSFRAFPRRTNGVVGVKVETVGEPALILDEDSIVEGAVNFDFVGARDRYNQVIIRFPNELNRYERDEFVYPEAGNPLLQTWLDEDGGRPLVGEYEFETFAAKSCAAQMAEIIAKRSRVNGVLSFKALDVNGIRLLEPGDIFGVSLESFGWNEKPFRLKAIKEQDDGFDIQAYEHENVVYPWSGGEWSEQVGGSELGDPANIQPPTNLSINPDPTFSTAGTLRWEGVNNAFVRRYEVIITGDGVDVFDEELRSNARSWSIPLLDAGEYVATVRAISTIGRRSAPATLAFDLVVPVAPTDLRLEVGNWEVTSRPLLAGAGVGTQFDFFITENLAAPEPSEGRFRGFNATFTGLVPATNYRIWVRTVNPLGVSGWVSEAFETLEDPSQISSLVQDLLEESPIIGEVVSELQEQVNSRRAKIREPAQTLVDDILQELSADDKEGAIIRIEDVQSGLVQDITLVTSTIDGIETQVLNVSQVANNAEQQSASALQQVSIVSDDLNTTSELLQDAVQDINGNSSAIASLDTRVSNSEDFAQAQLILNSEFDSEFGSLSARAFLGTNVQAGGQARVTGLIVQDDGVSRVIEFQADTVRFVRANGSNAIVYDTQRNQYVFDGDLFARRFDGQVITADNLTADAIDGRVITGSTLRTAASGSRTEIADDGTYLIWSGDGAKNDANATFFIKKNGTGFVKGEFFQGELLESKSASGAQTATATGHSSAGQPVRISASVNVSGQFSGNVQNQVGSATLRIQRNGTTVDTRNIPIQGLSFEQELSATIFGINTSYFIVDTRTVAELRDYNILVTVSSPSGSSVQNTSFNVAIETFENKLPS